MADNHASEEEEDGGDDVENADDVNGLEANDEEGAMDHA